MGDTDRHVMHYTLLRPDSKMQNGTQSTATSISMLGALITAAYSEQTATATVIPITISRAMMLMHKLLYVS